MQIKQNHVNFRHTSGMPGVGKGFCHQPFCQVPRPTSRYLWKHNYSCTKIMSPEICHCTSNAWEYTWGGTVSFTVIINRLIPFQLNPLLVYIYIKIFQVTCLWSLGLTYVVPRKKRTTRWMLGKNRPKWLEWRLFVRNWMRPIVVIFEKYILFLVYFFNEIPRRVGSTQSNLFKTAWGSVGMMSL